MPPKVLGLLAVGVVTWVKIDQPVANIGQCTSRHLLPQRRVIPPYMKNNDMSKENDNVNRLEHPPGNQGARFTAGNQADNEKLATGIKRYKLQYYADIPSPTNSWPRFLVIEDHDIGRFDDLSSITLSRTLENLVGKLEMILWTKDGDLLVKCFTPLQSETLLKTTHMFEVEVNITH